MSKDFVDDCYYKIFNYDYKSNSRLSVNNNIHFYLKIQSNNSYLIYNKDKNKVLDIVFINNRWNLFLSKHENIISQYFYIDRIENEVGNLLYKIKSKSLNAYLTYNYQKNRWEWNEFDLDKYNQKFIISR